MERSNSERGRVTTQIQSASGERGRKEDCAPSEYAYVLNLEVRIVVVGRVLDEVRAGSGAGLIKYSRFTCKVTTQCDVLHANYLEADLRNSVNGAYEYERLVREEF